MRWRVERTKTKGLLFLRLFLFRSFCLKRMKSGYRADALSNEKPFVDFKEKFRSLDFFVSFFYQEKNEKRVTGACPTTGGVLTPKRVTNKI